PSLLSANFMDLRAEIKEIEKTEAEILHLDVMDGHFVPNLTFGLPIISQIRKLTDLKLDVHLMVTNPDNYIDQLNNIGADYISFHQEAVFHSHRLINQIKEGGAKAGIVLNPGSSVELINDVLPDLDFVLLMSVNPGFGGQHFLDLVYTKIEKLKTLCSQMGTSVDIEIDGGVTSENSGKLYKSGANILVAGSYVFKNDNYVKQVRSLLDV
ncbi:MAG: ribulose-phosphate 3-epimerase, partial [Candidatus Cloacimonadota bacterium]|nr:ribulose-phosphate 3-epimerase [Candidatus Cloacimonadota bacterium]